MSRRRLTSRITEPFQFAPGTRTVKRDGWEVLRAYDAFRRRITRSDPGLYPPGFQATVAVGEDNLPLSGGEMRIWRESYADFSREGENE